MLEFRKFRNRCTIYECIHDDVVMGYIELVFDENEGPFYSVSYRPGKGRGKTLIGSFETLEEAKNAFIKKELGDI